MGSETNDPLNYAYDANIKPKPYEPRLARLLVYMTEKEVAAQAQKMKQAVPENTPLRLGVPNYELTRVAGQALVEQWKLVGIKAEVVLLPEGKAFAPEANCDLVYLTATMWEPAIDIERLLGGGSPAKSNNPLSCRRWPGSQVAQLGARRVWPYRICIGYTITICPFYRCGKSPIALLTRCNCKDWPTALYRCTTRSRNGVWVSPACRWLPADHTIGRCIA